MKSIMGVFMMALFSLLSGSADALAERIKFSFSSLTGTQSPLWVAKEVGFFQKHGLDARLVYMQITDEVFLRNYYREALLKQINKTLYPDIKAVEFTLEQERKTNPAVAQLRPEDFVDTRFLDKLRKEGY